MAEGGDIPDYDPIGLGEEENPDDFDEKSSLLGRKPSQKKVLVTSTTRGDRNYEDGGARPKTKSGYTQLPSEEIELEEQKEKDEQYENRMEALQYIKSLLPEFKPFEATFTAYFDSEGNTMVMLSNRRNATPHILIDKNRKINTKGLPNTILKEIGGDYETLISRNYNTALRLNEANKKIRDLNNVIGELRSVVETGEKEIEQYVKIDRKELREIIEKQQTRIEESESYLDAAVKQKVVAKTELKVELNRYKDELEKNKNGLSNLKNLERSNERLQAEVDKLRELTRKSFIYNQEQIADLESKNEEILKNLPLRERVKYIFKKYGFTVFAVVSAVGVVIGVIVSNLSKGLAKLGKGVGNGLKTIGKKLGEILPGMVGAIVSFLFKTAGEVIGFLGKNAWLLIMAVVLYFVERVKKSR